MGRLFPVLGIMILAATVVALIDCLSTDKPQVRGLPRLLWAVLVVLLPVLGAVLWFVAGRPRRAAADGRNSRPTRAAAPEDDADFLRGLRAHERRQEDDLFRAWEADLRHPDDDEPPRR